MKINPILPIVVLACVFVLPVAAQTAAPEVPHAHAHATHAMNAPALDIPANAEAAVAVVDGFSKALASTDFKTVEAALDPAVIILESGGAERSREEYLGHHAIADAAFLGGAHVALQQRTARVNGDTAWVASESELHATEDGKPMTLLSTETMVLHKTADGWRIVHIHWSSRPKKEA
jgi:ketosteroid isomerase-like protein